MTSALQTANEKQHRSRGFSKLWVPEYAEPLEDFFLAELESAQAWLTELPMANISETARQVLEALVDFNRQPIPNEVRIRVAELFQQPVQYICQNLEKDYIDAALPLTAKNRRAIRLSQELYAELAASYKVFILEAFKHRERNSKRLVAIAIHRAITGLSKILHLATLEYEQYPDHIWQEIHFLYSLAVKNSIHRMSVQDLSKSTPGSSCIGDLYKRLLLYVLAAPDCLRQRENQFIYGQLLDWANFASLNTPDTNGDNSGQFLVRLASDAPPHHLSFEKRKLSKRCRILDTHRLVSHLNELLASIKPQPKPPKPKTTKDKPTDAIKLSKSILEHLIVNLSGRPKRRFSRTKLGYTLKLAVGIPHVHNLVKASALQDAAVQEQGGGGSENVDWLDQHIPQNFGHSDEPESDWSDSSSLLLDLDLEGDSVVPSDSHRGTMLEDNVQSPWAMNYSQADAEAYECETRNESAGGYCIDWGDAKAPKIKPGELVGIQSHATGKHFGVATTRWVKNTAKNRLQMGMQLIAPSSYAVEVRLDDEDKISCVYNGLLVPESKFAKIPLSLIVPTHSYQEGDILWVNSGNNELRVCLTQLLNATTSFSQYQIAGHHPQ